MTSARIILYGNDLMPYTVKVVRALYFKGLQFELVEPSSPEDFRRWSPETGLLPVIDIEGRRTPDSAAILDALDELSPDPPLQSKDPRLAREQRQLEAWVGETFGFYLIRWLKLRIEALGTRPAVDPSIGQAPAGPLASLGMLADDGKLRPEVYDTLDGGPGPEFERRLDDLQAMLGDRRYFHGDRLSRSDLAVFGAIHPLLVDRYVGARALIEARARLLDHARRIDAETAGP
jgi:glutathione S-transferase